MNYPFYVGDGEQKKPDKPMVLPLSRRDELRRPEKYLADPGLVDACNVALLLGQPLLLTGEPGTGKTLFASSLAWELSFDEPLKFETKSDSTARDLFYIYDALRHFQDVQTGGSAKRTLYYLTYQALGIAILRTKEQDEIKDLVDKKKLEYKGKCRSVVLIDEVDKAPRDFPNDILNELELGYFRVPELGNVKVEADHSLEPVVVITSNSEKDLPDAFLRRCVYYHIPFPEKERLRAIVDNRLGLLAAGSSEFMDDALTLFFEFRSAGLRKKPSTAELLGWILALRESARDKSNPLTQPELVQQTLSILVKTKEDQAIASDIVRKWMTKSQT